MIIALAIAAFLGAQDTDLILIGRPAPVASGGSASMTCGRLEVDIEWENVRDKGLQKFDGRMIFARKEKGLAAELQGIWSQSHDVYDVEQSCEAENTVLTVIRSGSKDGDLQFWELTIRDNFIVEIRGPFPDTPTE